MTLEQSRDRYQQPPPLALSRPDQVGEVLIEPIRSASVAFQVGTNITTTSASFRIPRVIADAGVVWSAEDPTSIPPTRPSMNW